MTRSYACNHAGPCLAKDPETSLVQGLRSRRTACSHVGLVFMSVLLQHHFSHAAGRNAMSQKQLRPTGFISLSRCEFSVEFIQHVRWRLRAPAHGRRGYQLISNFCSATVLIYHSEDFPFQAMQGTKTFVFWTAFERTASK